jgi:TetR/AcrR family transcriptional regulator
MMVSIKELKKKEKENRRKYILDAAQNLFLSKSYDNVLMNDIANEVEVNKATIYYYFKNKEALYFAVVLRGVRILVEIVKNEVEKGNTGFEKIMQVGSANKQFSNEYPDCLRLLNSPELNKFDVDNLKSSKEYKEVVGLLKEIILLMSDSIQVGVDDGTIRQDVDPMEAAVLISLVSQSVSNMSCFYKDMLESRGIDEQKFSMDVREFIHHMLMNKEVDYARFKGN